MPTVSLLISSRQGCRQHWQAARRKGKSEGHPADPETSSSRCDMLALPKQETRRRVESFRLRFAPSSGLERKRLARFMRLLGVWSFGLGLGTVRSRRFFGHPDGPRVEWIEGLVEAVSVSVCVLMQECRVASRTSGSPWYDMSFSAVYKHLLRFLQP